MIKIKFADLGGMEAYYANIGEEKLTIDENLEGEKIKALITKIDKDRPAHSQPVTV